MRLIRTVGALFQPAPRVLSSAYLTTNTKWGLGRTWY